MDTPGTTPAYRKKSLVFRGKRFLSRRFFRALAFVARYPLYPELNSDDLAIIESEIKASGIPVLDYWIDPVDFAGFVSDFNFGSRFYGGRGQLFTEKVLEHYIAYQLGIKQMPAGGWYLDLAACNSPWVKLLREKGYHADAIDLEPSPDFSHLPYYHVMDATRMALLDLSVDCASLQCALEMFICDADIRLMSELSRVVKPGGRVIIVPLYLHRHYCGYCTPEFWHRKEYHDPEAVLYVSQKGFGVPFSRKYDASQLKRRLIDPLRSDGFTVHLHALRNGPAIDPAVYCHFILEILRKGAS